MCKRTYSVYPGFKGGWAVRRHGTVRNEKLFSRKREAIRYALSIPNRDLLFVHARDGWVEWELSSEPTKKGKPRKPSGSKIPAFVRETLAGRMVKRVTKR